MRGSEMVCEAARNQYMMRFLIFNGAKMTQKFKPMYMMGLVNASMLSKNLKMLLMNLTKL